jgi:hypothetical protein
MAAYVTVTWTTGDIVTEAKLDNMVSNDRAEDAHESGITFLNNTALEGKDSGGTARDLVKINASDQVEVGKDNEGDHTVINAGSSKLVKIKVLRQDNTTNAYNADTVILDGWGWKQGVAAVDMSEAVTFGITFSEVPIVLAGSAGLRNGSDPSAIGNLDANNVSTLIHGKSITTGGFAVEFADVDANTNLSTAYRYGYAWFAMGVL